MNSDPGVRQVDHGFAPIQRDERVARSDPRPQPNTGHLTSLIQPTQSTSGRLLAYGVREPLTLLDQGHICRTSLAAGSRGLRPNLLALAPSKHSASPTNSYELLQLGPLERQLRVDLLFTDVVLPGAATGAQIATQAQTLRAGLKVPFTTGYARNAIVHHGRLDADVQLITKPFTYAELAIKVRDVLDTPS